MRRVLAGFLCGALILMSVPSFAWKEVTVSPSETLGSIAQKYRPHTVTEMDMVIAIRNANPVLAHSGFKSGMKLHIPTSAGEVRQAITGQRHPPSKVESTAGVPKDMLASSQKHTSVSKKEKPPIKQKPVMKSTSHGAVKTPIPTPVAVAKAAAPVVTPAPAPAPVQQAQPVLSSPAQASVPATSEWPWQRFWFVLFILTLILYLRARRRLKKWERAEGLPASAPPSSDPNLLAGDAVTEPNILGAVEESAEVEPEWRQVELDIPESDAPTQTHMQLSPSLTLEEEKELDGEQQDIINALSNDHDNIEWHMALLEFYIKTNNQNGFNRHFQNMLKTALMVEGDSLWEDVRKMYLNHWVYRGGKSHAVS